MSFASTETFFYCNASTQRLATLQLSKSSKTLESWYYSNTHRHPLSSIRKSQNQLLDSRSEILLSLLCSRETEAWQAWVTGTRSYTLVGVLGIKLRSFWHIETQAHISYWLGTLWMLASPPHTECATETAFVLLYLLPNVSNVTSSVVCKTCVWSLCSVCPARCGCFCLLLGWPWVFASFYTFDQDTESVWRGCPDIFSCLLSITATLWSLTLIMARLVFICFYQ